MRLLWSLAVFLGVWWLARSMVREVSLSGEEDDARPQVQPAAETEAMTMVCCAHCGVHLPQNEALESAGRFYCCMAHREAGPSAEPSQR